MTSKQLAQIIAYFKIKQKMKTNLLALALITVLLSSCNVIPEMSPQEKLECELANNAKRDIGKPETYRLIGIDFIDTLALENKIDSISNEDEDVQLKELVAYKGIHEYSADGVITKNLKILGEFWITTGYNVITDETRILFLEQKLLEKKKIEFNLLQEQQQKTDSIK